MKKGFILFLVIFSLLLIPVGSVAASGSNPPPPPPSSPNCESYIEPGLITLTAIKDSPTNAVVVGQDPNRTGVNLTWTLNIFPSIYTYGTWEIIWPDDGHCAHLNAECIINDSGHACCAGTKCDPFNEQSGNGSCVVDPNYLFTWGCVYSSIDYREDIVTLEPKAILTDSSRSWILNDLAKAYPGSYLKHPDWGFRATSRCRWENNVCVWTHSEGSVQVADPGWYDLLVVGTTAGTAITPPHAFTVSGGQFSVYLVETSKTGQQ